MERTQVKLFPDIVLLAAFAAAVLLWALGTGSLCSWDEGLYGEVSREILLTGNWIDLSWAGQAWSDKPPLYMWVTAFFGSIFGINEFSVRLFSALCGIGTVLATYGLGVRLYSRRAGICSALFLLSTWAFIRSARLGMLDSPLTFFIVLAFLAFKLGEERPFCFFFTPVAFSLAFLTKGMGAMLIPMILGLYMVFSRDFSALKRPALWAGILAGLLIAGWWHAAAIAAYGEAFIRDYFVKHLVTRTTSAVEGHTGDLLTYFGVIPNKGRPWAGIGLGLLPLALFMVFYRKEKQHILPIVWAVTVFVLFSLVKTKLHWYVVPIYPALALFCGWGLCALIKKYSVPLAFLMCLGAVVYLAADKDVFDLDFAPGTKAMALKTVETMPVNGKLYLYGISDPGMQFYLGGKGANIHDEAGLDKAFAVRGNLLMTGRDSLPRLQGHKFSVLSEEGDFLLVVSG